MTREAAAVITWGSAVPGREAKALEVFMDALGFWAKQAADGKIQQPEAYIAQDGSGGMLIIKGKADVLQDLAHSDEALLVQGKANLIVQDFKRHLYFTGDDEVQALTGLFARASNELGYM